VPSGASASPPIAQMQDMYFTTANLDRACESDGSVSHWFDAIDKPSSSTT
jgi:hypothetical protein